MKAQSIRPDELSASDLAMWLSLLEGAGELESPFLHPTYLQVLQEHRKTIEVGLLTEGPDTIGFFPFERHRWRTGQPAGARICDLQGALVAPNRSWSVPELMRGCKLSVWRFQQLPVAQSAFAQYHWERSAARHLDLSSGYDAYARGRQQAGSSQIAKTRSKRRKLEKEVGPLRFVWRSTNAADFRQLIEWKQAQRRRTRTFDVLQFDWVVAALDQLRSTQSEGFEGVLSTLYAGDRLVAVNLGMRTAHVLHHWFPSYDRELSRYSPGLILLLDMARAAAELGIQRIDMGKGAEEWKRSFASGQRGVAAGAVDSLAARRASRRICFSFWRKTRFLSSLPWVQYPQRVLRSFVMGRRMS